MRATSSKRTPSALRMSAELATAIQPAEETAVKLKRRAGRFAIYDLLQAVYRVHVDWKRRKVAKRSVRVFARERGVVQRKGMSPIRVLIEATLPNADSKQKSRWVRALEYLHSDDVPPSKFREFLGSRGGVAGCARLAVSIRRKRRRAHGDWND